MSNPNASEDDGPELPDVYLSDKAMTDMVAERSMNPDESNEAYARRILNEHVGFAVLGLVRTAVHGTNERIRTDAQKYIVERVLGKVGDDAFVEDPFSKLIKEVTEYVNAPTTK